MNPLIPPQVAACYAEASRKAAEDWPYVFGGGHSSFHGPYDCSGWVSSILHAGGLLGSPEDTKALEFWGLPGSGEWMTVWVINAEELAHTLIEFNIPGRHHWSVARHTGTICGWVPSFDVSGYTARRRKP